MVFKILVVDDDPDLEMLIQQKFRRQIQIKEIEFLFVDNGQDAWDKVKKDDAIDLVLADIDLPESEGLNLLAKLGDLNRTLKSVVVSPYNGLDSIRNAMNLGAYDFVSRPINLEDLEKTLMKAIENVKAAKEAQVDKKRLFDIDKELDVAKNIQSSIIPHNFKPFPLNNDFEISGTMIPARRVGGDFFDFFPLNEKQLGFSIADVSGKGVPAALFMTMSRGLLRAFAQKSSSTSECISQLNDILNIENDSSMFVTCFYGLYNIETGEILYCNAGHNPPYLIKANGHLKQIGRGEGIALGVTKDQNAYMQKKIKLDPGDTFLLYTDGVTEAMNEKKDLYTEEKLEDVLRISHNFPLPDLIQSIIQALENFRNTTEQTDDITLLAIRRR